MFSRGMTHKAIPEDDTEEKEKKVCEEKLDMDNHSCDALAS